MSVNWSSNILRGHRQVVYKSVVYINVLLSRPNFPISRIVVTTMIDIIWDDDGLDEAVLAILLLIEEEEETHRLEDDEMEEIEAEEPHVWGEGSRTGKAGNIDRRRVFYSHLLHDDFWGDAPVYDEMHFKRFFRLPKGLFDQIVVDLVEHDDYFRQKSDAAGKLGFTPVQKIASSVRLLTSGVSSSDLLSILHRSVSSDCSFDLIKLN